MNISELKKMSKAERIQVMEALWDLLLNEEKPAPPQWHEKVLEERKKKISNGKAKFRSLAELKASRT